jgi:FMN phosphatase YigB (HAD superfamily)
MPGAENMIQTLHQHGIRLGLLSNAQANTIPSLGDAANCFENELTILSYEERVAKPTSCLFEKMRERLALMGIKANETLLIGNDPLHDILPAKQVGFSTALFIGHPESIRPGYVIPDWVIRQYV